MQYIVEDDQGEKQFLENTWELWRYLGRYWPRLICLLVVEDNWCALITPSEFIYCTMRARLPYLRGLTP